MEIIQKNPIRFKNEKVENLNEAKESFFAILEDFLSKNPDKADAVNELKLLVEKAYKAKKAQYLMEDRLKMFDDYLNFALRAASSNTESNQIVKSSPSLFYLKQSKRFTFSE